MNFITSIMDKLQRHPKRVVFPEGEEPRVILAARQYYALRLGVPILLGDVKRIREVAAGLQVSLDHVGLINPAESQDLPDFARRYDVLRRYNKSLRGTDSREVMKNPLYFGAMMLWTNQVDGYVAGAVNSSPAVLRPLFQIIKTAPTSKVVSSCTVIESPDRSLGENGVLFCADCGVIPEPTVEQLSDIAVATAGLARQLTGVKPRVAMLSFSTKGSVEHKLASKMAAAAALARKEAQEELVDMEVDGELQAHVALVPEIARYKAPSSPVAGRANVLIFPDLNSGNIAIKLLQRVGHTNLFGQIILGMSRPAADIGRGSTPHDILGVAAIVGLQAIAYRQLYPNQ